MTKYISIDVETTGLDKNRCELLEFGAVYDDLAKPMPLESLPRFHCYIVKPFYYGEPYALAMHSKILKRIAVREPGYLYIDDSIQFISSFTHFLKSIWEINDDGSYHLTVAGKCFSEFDKYFIGKYVGEQCFFSFRRRVLDPATLYLVPEIDEVPPDLQTCLERAGIKKKVEHTAVEDALDVIRLLRHRYNHASCGGP